MPRLAQNRLYGDLAWTWPIISPPEDYGDEARRFRALLRRTATGRVASAPHLGSGGGHVDSHLKRLRLVGVDRSPQMVRLARRLNPELTYVLGDMRAVRLREIFDGVILSDAGAYLRTPKDLSRAIATAFRHLRPGGAFVTYAEHTRERLIPNDTQVAHGSRGVVSIVFGENRYDPDPGDTTFEATFLYLIRRRGRFSVERDRHILGLFDATTWRRSIRDAGFVVRHAGPDPSAGNDAPWFAAQKPL